MRTPLSTYRLQLNSDFTFMNTVDILQYLDELGISDVYASPIFAAQPGSRHGYDVADYRRINPELGGDDALNALSEALQSRSMGFLLDIVPNHMGIEGSSNKYWLNVLEHGRASSYARFFDIDWDTTMPGLKNKVLLPVLGDFYFNTLRNGELKLSLGQNGFHISYYDKEFPVSPQSTIELINDLERLAVDEPSVDDTAFRNAFNHARRAVEFFDPQKPMDEKSSENWDMTKREFASAILSEKNIHDFLKHYLSENFAASHSLKCIHKLHNLIIAQNYKLAFWKPGVLDINYRRFFDITGLAGVSVEHPEVFIDTHKLIYDLIGRGLITGLRIDHPDGLSDPAQYLKNLNRLAVRVSKDNSSNTRRDERFFILVEKILCGNERLPSNWPVAGTTGYEFLSLLNGLFIKKEHFRQFDEIFQAFTGHHGNAADEVYSCRRRVIRNTFIAELNSLTSRLRELAAFDPRAMDFSFSQIRTALLEVLSNFPVYRTYLSKNHNTPSPAETEYVQTAIKKAEARNDSVPGLVFDWIERLLLAQKPEGPGEPDQKDIIDFVMRFQQLSGPAMAKGFEDTAFYSYPRFISLNDVGGELDKFGTSVTEFHQANQERFEQWPSSLLTTTTHDTKRGEDVRARLNVLSEMPGQWREKTGHWSRLNEAHIITLPEGPCPDKYDEYFLYQTLTGSWPTSSSYNGENPNYTARLIEYMIKAAKEAKRHTSWTQPCEPYENGLKTFVKNILSTSEPNPFLSDFIRFQSSIAFFAKFNSLSQTLLKMTVPGVPDFFQGSELWDLRLVDPDNRRPVDFESRFDKLLKLKSGVDLNHLIESDDSGDSKLYIIWKTMNYRKAHPSLFDFGNYIPLQTGGAAGDHVCAFLRKTNNALALVAVPRLVYTLTGGKPILPIGDDVWRDTTIALPPSTSALQGYNILTHERTEIRYNDEGGSLRVADLFHSIPLAILE